MKHIAYALLINTTLAFGAATSITGPLEVGKFHPYVTQTATNQINKGYLPHAQALNNGTLPTGSISNKWHMIGYEGVEPYFKVHKKQLATSDLYVTAANTNEIVTRYYERARKCAGGVAEKAALWECFTLSALAVFGVIEKETIPEIDLKPITVAGIIDANQRLFFTSEENLSFGGAIAATVSIMNTIYKDAPDAFKTLYKEFLPQEPESTDE